MTFNQGEDLIIELSITDSSGSVDLTDALEIRAIPSITSANVVTEQVPRYSFTPKSGYGKIAKKSGQGNENIIQIFLERQQTAAFAAGVLSFVVATRFENVAFPSGFEHKEYVFSNTATVNAIGPISTEPLP